MRFSWSGFVVGFALLSVAVTIGLALIFVLKFRFATNTDERRSPLRAGIKWWLAIELLLAIALVGLDLWMKNDPAELQREQSAQRDAQHSEWNKQQLERRKRIITYAGSLVEEVPSLTAGEVQQYSFRPSRGPFSIPEHEVKKVPGLHPWVLSKPYPTIAAIEQAIGRPDAMPQPNLFVWKGKLYEFPQPTWENRDQTRHLDEEKEFDVLKVTVSTDGSSVELIEIYRYIGDPRLSDVGPVETEMVGRRANDWSKEK